MAFPAPFQGFYVDVIMFYSLRHREHLRRNFRRPRIEFYRHAHVRHVKHAMPGGMTAKTFLQTWPEEIESFSEVGQLLPFQFVRSDFTVACGRPAKCLHRRQFRLAPDRIRSKLAETAKCVLMTVIGCTMRVPRKDNRVSAGKQLVNEGSRTVVGFSAGKSPPKRHGIGRRERSVRH